MTSATDIAVIGRSCRLPGAASVNDLWTLLASGTCAVGRVPDDRWAMARMTHPRGAERGKSYTWAAGTLDDVWGFDPAAFGLSPREAEQMDPQQRLLLELTWEALEDAGVKPSAIAGSDAGVFIGASALDYGNLRINDVSSGDAYLMTGNTLSIISNRISYIFDLHGPSFTVDTACSSALVALNEAVVSLRSGRVDTAIVGGVNVLASPFNFIGFSQAAMLSRVGLCQAFAAGADGYVRAEGGVVLVLRTREAAERDGNAVHGFVIGSDVNSDGRTNGISLPSKIYQARLLESLYLKGGIDPATLAFVEAHGTGTRVGDPIEATAIGETLARKRGEPLLIGSIKTNIGHMEAASGLGGVLKAMLALEHDQLPASLHSGELNPDIDFAALNLRVARELTPLAPANGRRRIAGVNSFGFGGTNAHVVLADGPNGSKPAPQASGSPPAYLVVSAHSRAALAALVADYASRLEEADEAGAQAIVAAAAHRRDRLPHRVVVPMGTRDALVATLDRLGDAEQDVAGAARGTAIERDAPVAAVFSGNGAQYVGMGVTAYARNARFREHLDLVSSEFAALAGWSIVETMHDPALNAKLELAQIAQPLLYAVQAAAYQALLAGGMRPALIIGHSVGEVAAAEAAGILDRAGALKTILARSLHQELASGLGGMAVVIGSQGAAENIIAALPSLEIAAYNSPRAFTVSGSQEHIDRLSGVARGFKARIRKLDLAYPFHSALMAPVERPLLRSLADLKPGKARLPFISTVTGGRLDGQELDARYWWRNVREPVRFSRAVAHAVKAGARVFIEVGPTASLLSHIGDCVDERTASIATLCALDKKDRGEDPIAATLATALARGAELDEARAFGTPPAAGTVALPLYPWQRKTYRLPESSESPGLVRAGTWHPLIGARLGPDRLEWNSTLDTALHPSLADHCVDGRAILPGAAFAEMALAVARDWLGTAEATITDLEITSPMILTADASREVACRLSPHISHLEIVSRPRLGQTPWQTHATAKIVKDTAATIMPDPDDHGPISGTHVITGPEIYAMAARAGLQYGPTFRKLATAVAGRPDRITLDLTKEEADPAYGADPARMDACFHALVLIFSSLRDAVHGTAYIPVRFGEIMLRRPGATFTRARIDVLRRDERIIIANFFLTDEAGDVIVFMREARFQAIRTSRGVEAGKQMIVQTSVLASEPTAARVDRPLALAALRRGIAADASGREAMAPDFVLLEGWATAVALGAARDLATASFIDTEALVASGRLPARVKPWLEDLLVSLDRSGLSHRDKLGRHIDPDVALPDPDEILRTLAAEHQDLGAEMLVAASVEAAVKALTAGDLDTFLRPLSTKTIDGWELGGSQAHAAAETLIGIFKASQAAWPRDRAMRVLQVGYGPLTGMAAGLADATEARLTILDPDRRRLERARMTLATRGDVVFLDKAADLPTGEFDFVLAAHALHRHKRNAGLWSALRRAMAQGAIFAAVEPAPSFFRDLVLGLDARLTDDAADFDGLSVTEADWLELMQTFGLGDPEVTPIETANGGALLLTAQAEAERRHWSGTGDVLIVGADDARGTETTSAFATLLASSGLHVSITLDCDLSEEALAKAPETLVVFVAASDDHVPPVKALLDQCMRLKRLADGIGTRKTALWLVTSGAVGSSEGARASDVAAGVWAFSRTLANEVPTLDVRRVDLAAELRPDLLAERLRDLVLSKTDETEILLSAGVTRVVRFEAMAAQDRGQTRVAEAARLARGEGSGIDRIHWEAIVRHAPGPNDVEVAVEAIGLNFRDVMFGLGLLPEDILEHGFAGPTLGLECAGRVERVGAAVKGLKPGDRVIAFAKNAFATHVTTPAAVVAPIPNGIASDMAATIPVAFLTAYHALMLCARLKPAEWVLIHGGAGGVGLAAIQIARWRGARVIATAGSPEKRALLASLGAEQVFDSRSGAFVEDVRRVTGEGVAVVLNSLSGEAMERSIGVLRPFGRFVELGKRDYVANTHVGLRPFRRNLSYFGVDLDQLLIDEPTTSRLLMRSVLGLFAKGALTPLPFRAFEAAETVEAFRLMQQSGHIGKLVVRPPPPGSVVVRQRRSFQASADKIHLLTGGFGGFGLEAARWLVDRGAKNLLLLGRSGAASQPAREALATLAASGVRVRAEAVDVADKAAVQRLFARFGKDLPVLGGVIHAAMVLDDATLPNVTAARFEQVLRPKVAGADHLDQLTRTLPLDYFVLFSSATTLIGNPGQAAYVAANGYLEGLARRRRTAGLPALAICWGAIEDAGVLARSEGTREALAARVGIKGMLAQDALRLMGEALSAPASPDDAVVTIAPMNWTAARQHLAVLRGPSYAKLTSGGEAKASEGSKIDIAALIASSAPEEARKVVSGLIVEEIARVLRLPREDIAKTTALAEIGLDSLMAVELALGLEERFALKAPLSATASSFSVNELADHVIGLATGALSGDEAVARNMVERHLGPGAAPEALDAATALIEKSRNAKPVLL